MVTLSLADAIEYAPTSLDVDGNQLILDSVLLEIDELFPGHADNARFKMLALKLFTLEAAYDPEEKNAQDNYARERSRILKAAGYRPRLSVAGAVATTPASTPSTPDTPSTPSVPGDGISQSELDDAIQQHANQPNIHHSPPVIPPSSDLSNYRTAEQITNEIATAVANIDAAAVVEWDASTEFSRWAWVSRGAHLFFKYSAGTITGGGIPEGNATDWRYVGGPRIFDGSGTTVYQRGDEVVGSDNTLYYYTRSAHGSVNPVGDTSGHWYPLRMATANEIATAVNAATEDADKIDYNALKNLPTLFSGAYADLTGKPNIPPAPDLTPFYNSAEDVAAAVNAATDDAGRIDYENLLNQPDIPSGGGDTVTVSAARTRVGHLDSVTIATGGVNLITLTEDVEASADYQFEITDDVSGMAITSVKIPGELILAKTDLTSTPANLSNALITSILTTRFANAVAFDNNAVSRWNVLKGTSDRTLFLVNANGSDRANTVEVWKYPRVGAKGVKGDAGNPAAAGTARGDLIAHTTGAFPTGTLAYGSAINGVTWTLATNPAPPSLVVLRSFNLTLQPTTGVSLPTGAIGLWFVAETVSGGVATEIGIPSFLPLHSFRNDNNETRPILLLSGTQRLTIANQMRDAGTDAHGFLPRGGGTALPANLRLCVYWALAVGPKGDSGYGDVYFYHAKGSTERFGDDFPNNIDPVNNIARLEFASDTPNEKFHTTANPASWWVANPTNLDSTGAPAITTPRVVFQPPAGTWKLSLPFKMQSASQGHGIGLFEVAAGTDVPLAIAVAGSDVVSGFAPSQVTNRLESDELTTNGTRQFYFRGNWHDTSSLNYYLRAEKVA